MNYYSFCIFIIRNKRFILKRLEFYIIFSKKMYTIRKEISIFEKGQGGFL